MQTQLNPYLSFQDNARQAMEFTKRSLVANLR